MVAPNETHQLNRVLVALERARVIRSKDSTYELTHDFLAHKIASTFTEEELKINDAKKILRERFNSYKVTKSLLTKEELKLIRPRIASLEATADQEKFIDRSAARLRSFYAGVGVVAATLLIGVGIVIYLFVLNQKAIAVSERESLERRKFALLARAKDHFLVAETFFAAYSKGVSSPTLVNNMIENIAREGGSVDEIVTATSSDDDHTATSKDRSEGLIASRTFTTLKTEPGHFKALLDSAEVNYEKAWRLDNSLFSALVGLIKVQVNKDQYKEALGIFRSETDTMKWELKNVVFFQTLQTMEFGRDTLVVKSRMDFLFDFFHELYVNQQGGNEQLTYAAVRLLDLSYQYDYGPTSERLANLIAGLEQSIEKSPDPDLSLVLGAHFLRDDNPDTLRAIKHFDQIDDNPGDTLRRFRTSRELSMIASVLLRSGNKLHQQKAVQYLKSALAFDERSQKTLILLGQYYYENGDYLKALGNLRRAAAIKPDKIIFHDLGLICEQLNDPDAAARHYIKALDYEIVNVDYFSHLASIYYDGGHYESANDAYDAILIMEPENEKALHFKAKSLEALGRYEEAYEISIRLRELWPADVHYEAYHFAVNAANLAEEKPKYKSHYRQQSRLGYRRAIALAEVSDSIRLPALYDNLAIALIYDSIDLDEAVRLSGKSIAIGKEEKKAKYKYTLSKAYAARRDSTLAKAYLNSAILSAVKNKDTTLLNSIGEEEFHADHYESSLNVWERILKWDPEHFNALHFKGKNLEQLGKYEQAIEIFEKLNQLNPNVVHVLDDHLRSLYFLVSDTIKGRAIGEQAISLVQSQLEYFTRQSKGKATDDVVKAKSSLAGLYNDLAWDMALRDYKLDLALHYSEKSLELCQRDVNRGYYLDTKAEIYLRMKKFDDALKANDEARKYASKSILDGINEREKKIKEAIYP